MKIVRTILFIINVLAALVLVLTTLAGTLAPSRTILPSLLAFGFRPMVAINLLFFLLWALMRRWEFLLSAAVIALRWSFVGLSLQVGGTSTVPDRAEHPQMVTVMTYNVHLFRGYGSEPAPSDDNACRFLALVREQQPDVLCLQEYGAPKSVHVNDSLELMGYNHYFGTHTSRRGDPYGTVVFSRLPITFVKRIDDEKLLVELLSEEKRLRVIAIHMDSYHLDDVDLEGMARLHQSGLTDNSRRTVAKVKETILSHEREWTGSLSAVVTESTVPTVLAGDLNDIPASWLYARITEHLTDTYCEEGSGFCNTYHGGGPAFRIDNIFRSDGLRTLSYRCLRTDISDHYPVLVALEFEP